MVTRLRRVRPAETVSLATHSKVTPPPTRVRRSRPTAKLENGGIYEIDWSLSLGAKLQLYLMTSFLYYRVHISLIKDHDFDRLCVELLEGWETFSHQHKHLVDVGQLEAGTGYALEYPLMVMQAATYMSDKHIAI